MAIRIISDSSTEFDLSMQEKWDIDIVPLHIFFGEEEFLDVEEIPKDKFFDMVKTHPVLPKTSQVTPFQYEKAFKKYENSGDDLIVIVASSRLTGGCMSATIASETVSGVNIHIVDSLAASAPVAVLVETAVNLRAEGKSAQEIVDELEKIKYRLKFYAALDSLTYLNNGGRVKGELSIKEKMTHMKPLLTITEGKFNIFDKIKGSLQSRKHILELAEKDGIDERYTVHIYHGGCPDEVDAMLGKFAPFFQKINYCINCMSGTLGAHFGPGTVSIGFVAKA